MKRLSSFKNLLSKSAASHIWTVLLCALMWLNLYYMHYEVYISKDGYMWSDGFTPKFFMCYDVLVSLFLFLIITLGKRKIAFSLTYLFLLFFVIVNTVYSRFLGQYLPLYALGETENFRGTWWMSYLSGAFRWTDICVLCNVVLSFFVIKRLPNNKSLKAPLHIICAFLVVSLFYVYKASRHDHISLRSYEQISNWEWSALDFAFNKNESVYKPNSTIFNYGIIEGQLFFNLITNSEEKSLTKEELSEIESFITERYSKIGELSDSSKVQGRPNIVMIVFESGLSAAVSERIDGKYVMPNINELTKQYGAYYNPCVKSNKGAGQSSDAQVSYFTGLIPLKSEFSILHVLKDSIIALPALLVKQGYNTCITIPNNEDFWHQGDLNAKYGFTNYYPLGTEDNSYWCQDKDIFKNVMIEQNVLRRPFFHVILTLSMHGGYEHETEEITNGADSFNFPSTYSKEYCNYLSKCNYTDKQVGRYIDSLKRTGKYDNTIIIVVSDHEVSDELKMSADAVGNFRLPLLIVNSGISDSCFSHEQCNQVDLFPTMLDMLGIDSRWRGVGHSLLKKQQSYQLTEREERISANILQGNYFKGK